MARRVDSRKKQQSLVVVFGFVALFLLVMYLHHVEKDERLQRIAMKRMTFGAGNGCFRHVNESTCRAQPGCVPTYGTLCSTEETHFYGCVDETDLSCPVLPGQAPSCPICTVQPGGEEVLFVNGYYPYGWQVKEHGCGACRQLSTNTSVARAKLPSLSICILVWNEFDSLISSLTSYKNGLFQYANDVTIFVQEINAEKAARLEPFTKPPYNLRVMSSPKNHGLFRGLTWVIGNSTSDIVLFLEKDFKLIETPDIMKAQLDAGREILMSHTADVVKFRSRWRPGAPNWAEILFRGKEMDVFKQQPNLLCNFYHWIVHPDEVWPDKFWKCKDKPTFYCTKSFYCNWTNNPVMFWRSWWMKNYWAPEHKYNDPYKDFEYYMNWEPGAWNDRNWVVASGEGAFQHHEINEVS